MWMNRRQTREKNLAVISVLADKEWKTGGCLWEAKNKSIIMASVSEEDQVALPSTHQL